MLKTNTNTVDRLIKSFIFLISVAGFILLQGCSSDDPVLVVTPDQDAKGYYDSGTAAVKLSDDTTDLAISDLQGMVSGNRFMLISVSEVLLYDGTMTIDSANGTYTATVNIYKDGLLVSDTTTVSGSFITESSMEGTLTGVGAGNGTFSLTYSLNNSASDLTRVAKEWVGPLNGETAEIIITTISNIGGLSISGDYLHTTPAIAGCDIAVGGTVLPISSVNVYEVTITLSTCTDTAVNGDYTGFATTQTTADNVLVLAYSNVSFSGSGILPIN